MKANHWPQWLTWIMSAKEEEEKKCVYCYYIFDAGHKSRDFQNYKTVINILILLLIVINPTSHSLQTVNNMSAVIAT